MACKDYDIIISALDIANATGNSNPTQNGTVFVDYTDCYGTPFQLSYSSAGTYSSAVCGDDSISFVFSYFNNNVGTITTNSYENQQSACATVCYNADATVSSTDLADATGNTDVSKNNKVFFQYVDCDGNGQTSDGYGTAGFFPDAECISGITSTFAIYYKNDVINYTILSSLINNYTICVPLTPTPTPTPTNTSTPTQTPTNTQTSTPTQTPTNTETPTQTPTNTGTPTQTPTNTQTSTPTQTPTSTQTSTPTPTPTSTGGYIVEFQSCVNSLNKFRFIGLPSTFGNGDTYLISGGTEFEGCATVVPYTGSGPIYNGSGVSFTLVGFGCGDPICPRTNNIPAILTSCGDGSILYANVEEGTAFTGAVYFYNGQCYSFVEFSGPGGPDLGEPDYKDCSSCTPTQTPTPTPQPTPTNTPTPSTTPQNCPNNVYCFRTTLSSLSGYSGNYTSSGSYNSRPYYSGDSINTSFIYYTGNYWCLSNSLGGSCLLQGATPCYSSCPDISANDFTAGICPSPTPLPIDCTTFDFSAYFDCNFEPTPTPIPIIDCENVNFEVTSVAVTPTPLPPVDNCIGTAVSFSLSGYTPVGPTVTSTPTQMPTPDIPSGGQVTFNMLEETFTCVSVKVLKLCSDDSVIYVNDGLVYNNLPLTTGTTFLALINNVQTCVTYVRDEFNLSSNANVNSVLNVYGNCASCGILPTPTPTSTSTQTPTPTQTQTQTPTPTNTSTPTQTPTQTSTQTPTPTTTSTLGTTPPPTPTNTGTPTPTPTQTPTQNPCNCITFVDYVGSRPYQYTDCSGVIVTGTTQPLGNFQPPNVFSVCGSNPLTNNPKFTFTINGLCSNRVNCDVIPTQTPTPTSTPTPTPTSKYVYVFESCVAINPKISSQLTQIIQDSPLSFVINVDEVFKDKDEICWRYVGRFGTNYIPPSNVNIITYSGDYFAGVSPTIYPNCSTCIERPLCDIPENLEKWTLVENVYGGQFPSIYWNFNLGELSDACNAWNWYYGNYNQITEINYDIRYIGVESLAIGNIAYGYSPGEDKFYCPPFPAGNYWLLNYSTNSNIIQNNPSSPDMTIIQIDSQGIITNITTCYFQP
jgi:hypothetical protein